MASFILSRRAVSEGAAATHERAPATTPSVGRSLSTRAASWRFQRSGESSVSKSTGNTAFSRAGAFGVGRPFAVTRQMRPRVLSRSGWRKLVW